MANQITDNRTPLFVAQTSGPASETWEASGGGGSVIEDVDIYIEGTTSVAEQISSSRRVMLFDNGSTQDLSNGHVYIWVNCGIVGILDTKAAGGMTVRLTGPTSTNFVEWYVGGSDSWPPSIQGGWAMFVVDTASATSNTGGTPPALTAIQKIGISAITNGTMTKSSDNTWVDAGWFLADGTPGIIVEGQNGGATDWDFADINTQVGTSAGTFVPGDGGSWVCNTPIQFGINDTSTHGFTDTNQTILWSDQEFAAADLYALTALGNSGGTTNVTMGIKSGTGDAATGAQGCTFLAAATGVRWSMDFTDADLDAIGLYGCSFAHGSDFALNLGAVEVTSSQYLDCTSALVSNSLQLRNLIVNANTLDDVAFMTTDDIGDIKYCTFEFSDGHAIELTTPRIATQTSTGNIFTGFTQTNGSTDAALYNNTAGLVDISVLSGALFYYKNGTSASTTVTVSVNIEITGLTEGTRGVMIGDGGVEDGNELLGGYANISGIVTGSFGGSTPQDVIVRARNGGIINAAILEDNGTGNTDYTDAARDSVGSNDVTLLPATPAINDAFYFGGIAEFEKVLLNITTAGDTYVLLLEYWNGAWVSLTATDNTNSFFTLGWNSISFTAPGDWATTTFNSQGPFYYIRARATTGGGTQPFAENITLNGTTKYKPFSSTGTIIASSGLSSTAVWVEDTINN